VRVECDSCRALVAASFGITGNEVRATCPACQHVMTAATAPVRAEPVADAGQALCPKCSAPRTTALACATCGLTAARMAAYAEAREAGVPDAVREAWRRATEVWSDPARHDELLRVVSIHDSYAWAASRYRTRRDDLAVRQLDRLRRAAEATLLATATARPDGATAPYRATRGVLMVLIVAVVVGLVYAMVIRARAPAPPAPPARLVPAQPLVPGHVVSPSTIQN
jgi:uncharacterized Zn finger protein (UPF0148 family)